MQTYVRDHADAIPFAHTLAAIAAEDPDTRISIAVRTLLDTLEKQSEQYFPADLGLLFDDHR